MALPQISIHDSRVDEAAGYAFFDVTLDAPSANAVTVEWATQEGAGPNAATSRTGYRDAAEFDPAVVPAMPQTGEYAISDFQQVIGHLTFAPGETRKTVHVWILPTAIPDAAEEIFDVALFIPSGATIARGTASGTIVDTELHTKPSGFVTPAAYTPTGIATAPEPFLGHGPGELAFRVGLSNAYFEPIVVTFATEDETAVAGSDYTAVAGTLTFAPGETDKVVRVPLLPDADAEPDETMAIVLAFPPDQALGGAIRAQGLILDMAPPPPEPSVPHATVIQDRALSYPLVTPFAGPAGLSYLVVTTDADEAVLGTGLGDFVNAAGGNDAVSGWEGNDVLDGGAGGNILVGGSGTDLFFIDARTGSQPIWTTVADLQPGESVVMWGMNPSDVTHLWYDGLGLPELAGATLVASRFGLQPVVLTLSGFATTDLHSGPLVTGFGYDDATGLEYFAVHAV